MSVTRICVLLIIAICSQQPSKATDDTGAEQRDAVIDRVVAQGVETLELEPLEGRVILITCNDNTQLQLHVPKNMVAGLGNQEKGVVFSAGGRNFLVLMKKKGEMNKTQWVTHSFCYDDRSNKWKEKEAPKQTGPMDAMKIQLDLATLEDY